MSNSATLGTLLTLRRGQSVDTNHRGKTGLPFLGMSVFDPEGGFRDYNLDRYSGSTESKGEAIPGDLLVAITDMGANVKILGRPARFPAHLGPRGVVSSDIAKADWRVDDPIKQSYAYWVMRTRRFRENALRISRGTAVRRVSPGDLETFPIRSTLDTRTCEIVRLLDDIEQQIWTLRRQNRSLEFLVHAHYHRIFTQEPNRASLSELVGLHRESTSPQKLPSEVFEHFSLPAFDDNRRPAMELGSDIKSNKTTLPDGAILVSKLNPHISRVWLPSKANAHRRIASTEFLVLVPREKGHTNFLWALFCSQEFRQEMISRVTGTSGSHQRVRPDDFLNIQVARPSEQSLRTFARLTDPLISRTALNLAFIERLGRLRDVLLPAMLPETGDATT